MINIFDLRGRFPDGEGADRIPGTGTVKIPHFGAWVPDDVAVVSGYRQVPGSDRIVALLATLNVVVPEVERRQITVLAALLEHGAGLICLEGLDGELPRRRWRRRRKSAFAAATDLTEAYRRSPVPVVGVDDMGLYGRQQDVWRTRPAPDEVVRGVFAALREALAAVQSRRLGPQLVDLVRTREQWWETSGPVCDVAGTLLRLAQSTGLRLPRERVRVLVGLVRADAEPGVEDERDELLRRIHNRARAGVVDYEMRSTFNDSRPPTADVAAYVSDKVEHAVHGGWDVTALMWAGVADRIHDLSHPLSNTVRVAGFQYREALDLARLVGIDMSAYPAWYDNGAKADLLADVTGPAVVHTLYDVIEATFGDLASELPQDDTQHELVTASQRLYLLDRLFRLELTPHHYDQLLDDLDGSRVHAVVAAIRRAGGTVSREIASKARSLDERLEHLRSYYDIGHQRAAHMAEATLQEMARRNVDRAVLVVTGFHRDTITRSLTRRHVSCILIDPKLDPAAVLAAFRAERSRG